MKVPDQDALAWDLFDVVRPGLDAVSVGRVSMAIVDRDYPAVIRILLSADAGDVTLPEDLRTRLRQWVSFYAGVPMPAAVLRHIEDTA